MSLWRASYFLWGGGGSVKGVEESHQCALQHYRGSLIKRERMGMAANWV